MTEPTNRHADAGVDGPGAGLDAALEALLAAIDTVNEELPYLEDQPEDEPPRWPRDPEDLLWAAQRTALAAEELGHLVARLGDYAEQWAGGIARDAELATLDMSRHSAAAYLARVKELPVRLHAAARALALAARRGKLEELRWFIESPRVSVPVGDVGRVDVERVAEAPTRYGVRDARSGPAPLHERERRDAPAGELVAAIAATVELDLADVQPRRAAREAADRARRELEAIVRYRDSGKPGDAEHAAQLAYHGDPADPEIAYAHRPDSTQDLVDALLDVHREQWPVAKVLQDCLAAAARVLGGELAGGDELLGHPAEDPEIAAHVRAILAPWARAAGEHERHRLADPEALRAALLGVIDGLGEPRRADAIAARVAVDRERIGPALVELEQQGLVARDDPLAAEPAWLLADAGRAELPDSEEDQ